MRKISFASLALATVLSVSVQAAPPETIEQLAATRAKMARITVQPDTSYLSAEERRVVNLLIQAAGKMSDIIWCRTLPIIPPSGGL